jgi:hypothetical protein
MQARIAVLVLALSGTIATIPLTNAHHIVEMGASVLSLSDHNVTVGWVIHMTEDTDGTGGAIQWDTGGGSYGRQGDLADGMTSGTIDGNATGTTLFTSSISVPFAYRAFAWTRNVSADHVFINVTWRYPIEGPRTIAWQDQTTVDGLRVTGTLDIVIDVTPPNLTTPSDLVREGNTTGGRRLEFVATATDTLDPAPVVACDPASGALFPLGRTRVTCRATDANLNEATRSFNVTIVDTTRPTLFMPALLAPVEATSPDGAVVDYVMPTATDLVDPAPILACGPPSGSTFPLGLTTVLCNARDASGNVMVAPMPIRVVDTTAPSLAMPDLLVEGDAVGGANVAFTPTAPDVADASPSVSCDQGSGYYALGTTTVVCTATDATGNAAEDSFDVRVVDTTPPTLTLPAGATAITSGDGAVVTFAASATDVVDAAPVVACDAPSGSTFPIGATSVTCTATDASGNAAVGSFVVTVTRTFPWSGFLQPINTDGSSVFRAGSTVPVKFRLDGGGATATFSYRRVDAAAAGAVNEANSTTEATSGTLFRYDAATGQYVYNWSTKRLATGEYELCADLGDGAPHTIRVGLR